ncbi:VOC family protein [Kribbella sp. NBC_00359]|uniref:VOC family protein n=1 Tax=Kribbella sp. NBC_00359 TaxID=2975966 RepID=UPI002E203EBD
MDMLSWQAIRDAQLDDWRKLAEGLHARFLIGSFADGARFVGAVGEACAAGGHAPEVRLGNGFADVRLLSDDAVEPGTDEGYPSVTQRDVDLARRISSIAQSLGLSADPSAVAQVELGLDTADLAAVGPFWAAVLTGDAGAYDRIDVCDPTGRVMNLWFQRTDAHETPRQRFHLDLWLPPEVVPARIEAALAAGGSVVADDEAPSFTVLADPEGNKVCLCTYLDR